jgi:hypothetical protein
MRRLPITGWIRCAELRETVGALSLLALLLQGFIPAGFMPAAEGTAAFKFCNGWTREFAGDPHHRSAQHTVSICPFAAAALLGAVPTLTVDVGKSALVGSFFCADRPSSQSAPPGPLRAQSPRAPPAFNS